MNTRRPAAIVPAFKSGPGGAARTGPASESGPGGAARTGPAFKSGPGGAARTGPAFKSGPGGAARTGPAFKSGPGGAARTGPAVMLAALVSLGAATGSAQEETVRDVIGKARRGQLSERLDAIRKLGSYTDPRQIEEWGLVDVLLEFVDDANPRAARAAVAALANLARGVKKSIGDQIIGPLAKIASDEDRHPVVRIAVVAELGRVIDPERFEHRDAAKTLVSVAGDTKQEVSLRVEAFEAIGKIAPAGAAAVIRKGLRDREPEVAEAAFEALRGCLRSPRAAEFADQALGGVLAAELRDPATTPKVKQCILEILALLKASGVSVPRGVETSLIEVLQKEKDAELVKASLLAVGLLGNVRAADTMVGTYERFQAADDPAGDDVRVQICQTAGTLFDYWSREKQIAKARAAADALIDLLEEALKEDVAPRVKREAAVSLGNLYDRAYDKRKAVMTLIGVVGHEEMGEEIKTAALDSLEVLTRKSFGDDSKAWEDWYKGNHRKLAPGRF